VRNFNVSLAWSHLQEILVHHKMNRFLLETVRKNILPLDLQRHRFFCRLDWRLQLLYGVRSGWYNLSTIDDFLILLKF
jgi:hypothetical protein